MRDYSKMQTLAERLKLVREEKGWSKAQLMRAAGVKSSSTMSELENGNLVHSPQIPAIAAALGVSALWLQSGRGSKVATQQTVPEDPAIEALAYLDRTMPARAALFRAQIIAAKQEAEHLELERVAITEHQVELAKVRLMKQVAAQA